jgi:PadR family transcriptional regulator PadR
VDTTQLLKGVLDAAVLAVVEKEDGYGYDVVRRLRAQGLDDVGDASVYGTLRRLYAGGALTSYVVPSEEGPPRQYYGITAHGRQVLAIQRKEWQEFAATLAGMLLSVPLAILAAYAVVSFALAQCLSALSQAAILFFVACGLTLIFGIMRVGNFAHGVIFMLGAYVGYTASRITGSFTAALIIPVFCYRHFIQDGGKFPEHMLEDLGMKASDLREKKAGILPYLTLVGGLIVLTSLLANEVAGMPWVSPVSAPQACGKESP